MFALPVEIKAALGFLLTNGIKSIDELFGGELAGKGAAVVAALVAAMLFFGEGAIALLDPDEQETVVAGLNFAVLLFGMFGVHRTGKMLAGKTNGTAPVSPPVPEPSPEIPPRQPPG